MVKVTLWVELGSFAGTGVVRHKCGRRSQQMRKIVGIFKRNRGQIIRPPPRTVTERGRLYRCRADGFHNGTIWFQQNFAQCVLAQERLMTYVQRLHLQRYYINMESVVGRQILVVVSLAPNSFKQQGGS